MKVALIVGTGLLLAVALLGSCDRIIMHRYEHGPSEGFHESVDFDAGDLAPFTVNGILFVIDIDHMYQNIHTGWLTLYARAPGKSAFIREVEIKGAKRPLKEVLNAELTLAGEVGKSSSAKHRVTLFRSYIELFRVDSDWLEDALDDEEMLTVIVSYSVDDEPGAMSFKLAHRTQNKWPHGHQVYFEKYPGK